MARRYVVVIVTAVLVLGCAGLILPAIVRVREVAARMTCCEHFYQLGIAFNNHAEVHNRLFPAGTISNANLPPEQRLSWYVSILPFIEGSVFNQFDLTRGPVDERNGQPTNHRFRQFICPSSGEYSRGLFGEHWKSNTPLTHYVGVAGVGVDAAILPSNHPRAGVFGYDRSTRLKEDIPDGLTNTLLLMETSQNPGHWAFGGSATIRGMEREATPYIGPTCAFGGFHSGPFTVFQPRTRNCVVGIADGSVRQFTNTTSPEVLEALATVDGKEALPGNW